LVNNATDGEKEAISSRIDVKNTGTLVAFRAAASTAINAILWP
jgi:hypothetical protein